MTRRHHTFGNTSHIDRWIAVPAYHCLWVKMLWKDELFPSWGMNRSSTKAFWSLDFWSWNFLLFWKVGKNIHNKNISVGKYTIFSDKLVTILTKASENGYVWISNIYCNFNLNTFFFKSKVKEPPLKGLHRGLVV